MKFAKSDLPPHAARLLMLPVIMIVGACLAVGPANAARTAEPAPPVAESPPDIPSTQLSESVDSGELRNLILSGQPTEAAPGISTFDVVLTNSSGEPYAELTASPPSAYHATNRQQFPVPIAGATPGTFDLQFGLSELTWDLPSANPRTLTNIPIINAGPDAVNQVSLTVDLSTGIAIATAGNGCAGSSPGEPSWTCAVDLAVPMQAGGTFEFSFTVDGTAAATGESHVHLTASGSPGVDSNDRNSGIDARQIVGVAPTTTTTTVTSTTTESGTTITSTEPGTTITSTSTATSDEYTTATTTINRTVRTVLPAVYAPLSSTSTGGSGRPTSTLADTGTNAPFTGVPVGVALIGAGVILMLTVRQRNARARRG